MLIDVCLPAQPGSYALRLRLPTPSHLAVGRLGLFDFSAGDYLYLGSAWGPGGIRARLLHHIRPVRRPHWHLDFLRMQSVLTGGWYSTSPGRLECAWSQAILLKQDTFVPAPGFGAADCRSGCPAHLLALPCDMENAELEQWLHSVCGFPAVTELSLQLRGYKSSKIGGKIQDGEEDI